MSSRRFRIVFDENDPRHTPYQRYNGNQQHNIFHNLGPNCKWLNTHQSTNQSVVADSKYAGCSISRPSGLPQLATLNNLLPSPAPRLCARPATPCLPVAELRPCGKKRSHASAEAEWPLATRVVVMIVPQPLEVLGLLTCSDSQEWRVNPCAAKFCSKDKEDQIGMLSCTSLRSGCCV